MSTTLYQYTDDGGVHVIPGRKAWGVDIPAYVYDVWMPLLTLEVIGVYGFLWRLARNGQTKGIGIKKLAKACRIGDVTFTRHCNLLKKCGFIEIMTPNEEQRKHGFSTSFTILDPPMDISPELMKELDPDGHYEPATWWLFEEVSPDKDTPSPTEDTVSPDEDFNVPLVEPLVEEKEISRAEARPTFIRESSPVHDPIEVQPEEGKVPPGRMTFVQATSGDGAEKWVQKKDMTRVQEFIAGIFGERRITTKQADDITAYLQELWDADEARFNRFAQNILTCIQKQTHRRRTVGGFLEIALDRHFKWYGWNDFYANETKDVKTEGDKFKDWHND